MQTKIFDYPITRLINKSPTELIPGKKYCLSYRNDNNSCTIYVFVFNTIRETDYGLSDSPSHVVQITRTKHGRSNELVEDTLSMGNFSDNTIDICKVSDDFPNVWSHRVEGFRV